MTRSITPDDVTGLAALDPQYAMKAQQVAGLPLDKQVSTLLDSGLNPSTVALVLKARKLKELSSMGAKPADPRSVDQEVDQAIQNYAITHARNMNAGIPTIPLSASMFGQNDQASGPVQGKAKGGIIAFGDGGGVSPNLFGFGAVPSDMTQVSTPIPAGTTPAPAGTTPTASAQPSIEQLTAQYLKNAYGARGPMDALISSVGGMRVKPDLTQVNADRADARKVSDMLTPKGNEQDYQDRALGFAQAYGMNKGEAEGLVSIAKYRDDMNQFYSQEAANRRGLAKASQEELDFAEKRIPMSNLQGALVALALTGKNVTNAQTEAKKALADAKMDTSLRAASLQNEMYKNFMGTRKEGSEDFKQAYLGYNDAKKREDELDRAVLNAETQTAVHNQQMKLGAAQVSAYARDPYLHFQPGLDLLTQQRAEAAARKDTNAVAAIDAAMAQFKTQATESIVNTPAGYAANVRAAAARDIANLQSITKQKIAAMNDGELKLLEAQLVSMPPIEGNEFYTNMRNNAIQMIADRKKELAAGGPGASAPGADAVQPRRIKVIGAPQKEPSPNN